MVEKRSKYDTDPLDADFVRRTEEMRGEATSDVVRDRPTEPMPSPGTAVPEDATRRLDDEPIPASYPSVFIPPTYQPPATYNTFGQSAPPVGQTPAAVPADGQKPSSRTLPGLGLPENVAMVLPYAPFYIGVIAGLVELFLVPRSEWRTRFHAAQGLALQGVVIALTLAFSFLRFIPGSGVGRAIFALAGFVFLIVSMLRVWKGEKHHITALDELTRWINQQIEPRK